VEREGGQPRRRRAAFMTGGTDWGQLALDIHLAAQTRAPVLISAPPECAEKVARAIAAFSSAWKSGDLIVCDCAGGEGPMHAVSSARDARGADTNAGTLLLREVHALGEAGQAEVAQVVAGRDDAPSAPRVISTTSVSLFDRVRTGAFDERLFYRLNVMHIVVTRQDDARPE
jgi:DNA-binding NtrC family response regulator